MRQVPIGWKAVGVAAQPRPAARRLPMSGPAGRERVCKRGRNTRAIGIKYLIINYYQKTVSNARCDRRNAGAEGRRSEQHLRADIRGPCADFATRSDADMADRYQNDGAADGSLPLWSLSAPGRTTNYNWKLMYGSRLHPLIVLCPATELAETPIEGERQPREKLGSGSV